MSQARSRRARRPRGEMAELPGPTGAARDAASQIRRAPEAGDRGEKTGGGTAAGWRADPQEEVQDAERAEAGQRSGWEF